MPWLTDFLSAHIIAIEFIYGLGFFTLGMAVALEAGHASALPLARATPWLAAFALLHALAEWSDLAIDIAQRLTRAPVSLIAPALTGPIEFFSFMALLRFGCELRDLDGKHSDLTARIMWAVLGVYMVGFAVILMRVPLSTELWIEVNNVWSSYSVGIPAFIVTVWGLFDQSRVFRARNWPALSREIAGTAIALCWYALFDVVFVAPIPYPPASVINSALFMSIVGVPIELFRAINALVIAFFFIRALRIFAEEDRRRLEEAVRHERQLQAGAEALNNELREAAKEMAALYDQLRQRDEVHSFLLKRVVRAQEDERRRVARDLHDGVGQTLSGLATGLAALESRFQGLAEPQRKQMETMKAYAMQSVEELHRVITDLRPSLLDDLGLVAALRWYARHYAETLPLTVNVDIQGHTRRLPPEIETVLFRIAQESLTNVVRHARSNYATIRLSMNEQQAVLEVEDDGVGFDPTATFAASGDSRPWGLLGMQERADLVGGSVDIQSQAWKGSKVTVTIPLPATAAETERDDHARVDS